jgi:predicted HicB family RNase H-like nuclease
MPRRELLHYRKEVFWSEEDDGFIARLVEFPSLSSFGASEERALRELHVAVGNWLAALKKRGQEPPEPFSEREYSGEFRLRVPKDLHRELAIEAARNEVSLNTYCVEKLARSAHLAAVQGRRLRKGVS